VVAVITAFQPGDALVRACEAVTGQVGAVVVVDDGSPEPSPRLLEACRALGAVVERHETNRGIGAALGTGIATARTILAGVLEPGDEGHVLTLDQDSAVEAGYVDALLAAAHIGAHRTVAIEPAGKQLLLFAIAIFGGDGAAIEVRAAGDEAQAFHRSGKLRSGLHAITMM